MSLVYSNVLQLNSLVKTSDISKERLLLLTSKPDQIKSLTGLGDSNVKLIEQEVDCCDLQIGLISQLNDLVKSGQYDYVIIEGDDSSDPFDFAEILSLENDDPELEDDDEDDEHDEPNPELSKKVKEILKNGGLSKLIKIDSTLSVISSGEFFDNFNSIEFVGPKDNDNEGEDEEDESTLTDALISQIELADYVLLTNVTGDNDKVKSVVKALNPSATVFDGNVEAKSVLNTNKFDNDSITEPHWVKVVKNPQGGDSSFEENGVVSFVYRRRQPFHPERLHNLIKSSFHFIQSSENPEDDEEWEDEEFDEEEQEGKGKGKAAGDGAEEKPKSKSSDFTDEITTENLVEAVEKKKQSSIFNNLLRSKGSFWLDSRNTVGGAWNQSGPVLGAASGELWYNSIPPEDELKNASEDDITYIKNVAFEKPFGDRRQEIYFVGGPGFNRNEFEKALDGALLTNDEMKSYDNIFNEQLGVFERDEKLSNEFKGDDLYVPWIDSMIMALMDEADEDEE